MAAARATPWTLSSTPPGISIATWIRKTRPSRLIPRRPRTGSRGTRPWDRQPRAGAPAADRRVVKKLHQAIPKVTEDFDNRWHFNPSIAALMELINTLEQNEPNLTRPGIDAILPSLVLLLGPFAPYTAEELWDHLGRVGPVFRQTWPQNEEEMTKH